MMIIIIKSRLADIVEVAVGVELLYEQPLVIIIIVLVIVVVIIIIIILIWWLLLLNRALRTL